MKCPKCGYNSFEALSACKKCSHDLTAYKEKLGLRPIVFPIETRNAMVAAMNAEAAQSAAEQQPAEQPVDMFSFDIPDDVVSTPAPKAPAAEDFFNFDDKPAAAPASGFTDFTFEDDQVVKKPATMDDAFASLLESTPRSTSSAGAPPAAPAAAPAASPGEFDLDSFSWDEPPGTTEVSGKKTVDDFDSLFGEISDKTKK